MLVKLSRQIYIARRILKDNNMVMNLLELNIATVNSEQIHYAVNLHWKDFEDAVQYSVAKFNDFDGIVTRNLKGFHEDGVKIFMPEEILKVGDIVKRPSTTPCLKVVASRRVEVKIPPLIFNCTKFKVCLKKFFENDILRKIIKKVVNS